MGFIKEFKEFAVKGNMVDMAVGIIIGAAFGGLVKTLVDKIFMPPLGLLMGNLDFKDYKLVLQEAVEKVKLDENNEPIIENGKKVIEVIKPEVGIYYGEFITDAINFIIVAFVVFLLIKGINQLKRKEEEKPATPPRQETLLEEIRDAIKAK